MTEEQPQMSTNDQGSAYQQWTNNSGNASFGLRKLLNPCGLGCMVACYLYPQPGAWQLGYQPWGEAYHIHGAHATLQRHTVAAQAISL